MKCNTLEINLDSNEIIESTADGSLWLGGRGLAVKLFTDIVDPKCDPLGPGNVMVFAVSPLTGTTAPTAGRGHVVFKSPLTGAIGSANSGGKWGRVLKGAGYDALIIKGASQKPVYITINDGESLTERVAIHDASDLWGKDVPVTTDILAGRHGGKACSVLVTSPAGEKKVRFAALMNEYNRAYGRGGSGAVLGSKNVKAIVVKGDRKTGVVEPERFKDVIAQTRHVMKAAPATKNVLRELGTAGLVELIEIMGILPHRNFSDCRHDMDILRNITGETMTDTILEKAGGCFGCPIMCQRHTRVGDKKGEGPEYETMVLMGPLLDIYDLNAITLGNYVANEMGMDTMSLGVTLACAAELFEMGAISATDTGGVSIRFGDASMYPHIVELVAARSGIGDLLAEGSRSLAERFGHPETAMHVKGMELPAYDPRGMPAQAVGYMTSPTGACHLRGGYSISLAYFGGYKEVPRFSIRQAAMTAKNQQDIGIIQDSLGICRFTGYATGAEHWAKAYSAATGEDASREAIEEAAERIATLERIFNIEAGMTRADDDLPPRFKTQTIAIGDREYLVSENDRNRMLDDYYMIRGWDKDGVPLKETCEKLEIKQ